MKKISNGAAAGVLVVFGLIFVIALIGPSEPKCSLGGCDKDATEGSRYCYLHDLSYRTYGNADYNAVYRDSQSKKSRNSGSSSTSKGTSSSAPSNRKTKTSSSEKTYSSVNSYDEGYEDVYENDDYDWDRYYNDDEYADGVDDAMDELDW